MDQNIFHEEKDILNFYGKNGIVPSCFHSYCHNKYQLPQICILSLVPIEHPSLRDLFHLGSMSKNYSRFSFVTGMIDRQDLMDRSRKDLDSVNGYHGMYLETQWVPVRET